MQSNGQTLIKKICYFADLTHTTQGIHAKTFPLGAGLVAAYAKQQLGNLFDIKLFKFPDDLESAFLTEKPDLLCMSNYAWNTLISYTFAKIAKEKYPDLIVIFGGPNFPLIENEQLGFLKDFSAIDFYIVGEGEESFVGLLKEIIDFGYDIHALKDKNRKIHNCVYLNSKGYLIRGDYKRIKDLERIPCPYTTGLFNDFFHLPLIPLYETTRGCPFSCTYCSDGVDYKSKAYRYSNTRIKSSLEYIAYHIKDCDTLIISDLNFGMYDEDITTCKIIADLKERTYYPKFFQASAGKNKPDNILKCAQILNGSWIVGASVQSTDEAVLENIKRKNISTSKMMEFARVANETNSVTYTEVILGLPGDTKEKHFESLRIGIDMELNSIKMYQLMLLTGTEINSEESQKKYGMQIRWRVPPGCAGIYDFFGSEYRIAELEKIVVANNTLSFDDYLECRLMDFIVEVFINNAWFEELFALISLFSLSRFDFLLFLKDNIMHLLEKDSHANKKSNISYKKIKEIAESFKKDTVKDLFDTNEAITEYIKKPSVLERHITGELGNNEILDHKALCYLNFQDTSHFIYQGAKEFLKDHGLLTEKVKSYLSELQKFTLLRKAMLDKLETETVASFKYDFVEIQKENFRVDPNKLKISKKLYKFWHDPEQKIMIKNAIKLYGNSIAGLGRFIQRTNMKMMYRKFKVVK